MPTAADLKPAEGEDYRIRSVCLNKAGLFMMRKQQVNFRRALDHLQRGFRARLRFHINPYMKRSSCNEPERTKSGLAGG